VASYSSGRRRAIALLLLTSVLLLTLDLRGNAVFDAARSGFSEVLEPVEAAAEVVTRPVRQAWQGISDYDELEEENRRLQQALDAQRGAEITNLAFISEHQQLLELDNLPSLADIPSVVATVVGASPTNLDQVIEIDRGRRDGIDVGMAVVNEAGLVGKITEVSRDRARVMLVTDEDYTVQVKVLGLAPPATTTTTTPSTTTPGRGSSNAPTTTVPLPPPVIVPGSGPATATTTTTTTTTTTPVTTTTTAPPSSATPGSDGSAQASAPGSTDATTTTTTVPELRERETGELTGRGRANLPQVGLIADDPTVGLVTEGDVVVTAGGDLSLAPPGIPVGEVENVIRRSSSDGPLLEIALGADVARLYFVRVVIYQPNTEVAVPESDESSAAGDG